MYIALFIFLIILCLIVLFWFHKKKIQKKVRRMADCEKIALLNDIIAPFGYSYLPEQDVFSSLTDAWQKQYGYRSVYDMAAPALNMIFDAKPIYFDYDGRTWLIEFWKGQYGISKGCEIGVYHADRILAESERDGAFFTAADEEEYLSVSLELFHKGKSVAKTDSFHWWHTIFSLGTFAYPDDLCLEAVIRFPDFSMRNAFSDGLSPADDSYTFYYNIFFRFRDTIASRPLFHRYILWKNKQFCRLYQFITNPFTLTYDKLIYLYFYLPFAFRRMLRPKKFRSRIRKGG